MANRIAYEVYNPSFNDMNLEEQIEAGINNWRAVGETGYEYFGRTREEAESLCNRYEPK